MPATVSGPCIAACCAGSPTPGGTPPGVEVAWGGALVLIVIVMLLNLVARVIGRIFAPKTGH